MTALDSSPCETPLDASWAPRLGPLGSLGTGIVGAAALGITLAAWHSVSSSEAERAQVHFNASVQQVVTSISERMAAYEQVLRGGVALFNATRTVGASDWSAYVRSLRVEENYPGILGIGFAPLVPASDRDAHVLRMRADGLARYEIWPNEERAEYVPVSYLERFGRPNPGVLGFDLLSEATRRAAVTAARTSGNATLSGRIVLMKHDTASRDGLLMVLPAYHRDRWLATQAERHAALAGIVYGVFRANDLVHAILGRHEYGLAFAVYDGAGASAAPLLYRSSHAVATPEFRRTRQIELYGRTWTLEVAARPGFDAAGERWQSRAVLIAGVVLSFMLMALMWTAKETRSSALRLAGEMTVALRESRALLRAVIDAVPAGIRVKDRNLRYVLVNESFASYHRLPVDALVGKSAADFDRTSFSPEVQAREAAVLASGELIALHEVDHIGPDGRVTTWLATSVPLRDEVGAVKYVVSVGLDITQRKQAERALAASERKYRHVVETQAELVTCFRPDTTLTFVNPAYCRYHGRPLNELLGRNWLSQIHEDDRAQVRRFLDSLTPEDPSGTIEHRIVMPDGEVRWLQWCDIATFDADGRPIEYQSVGRDVTERKLAELRLHESERQMRHLVESAGVVPYTWDVEARCYTYIGPQIERFFGHSPAQWSDPTVWMDIVHPEDLTRVEAWARDFDEAPRDSNLEYRMLRPDGQVIWVREIVKIEQDEHGRKVGYGSVVDVTDSKLRDGQLLQAQKMEAVGQLTSGIAHDFNNLLMIVIGNVDLLLPHLTPDDALARELAEGALNAGLDGAELTRQLLTFARKRPLQAVPLDLNALVTRGVGLLRRTLGEAIDIEAQLAADLWPIESDPAQLEAALTNLAINARDAMPMGGRLTISTANLHLDGDRTAMDGDLKSGDYVVLTVADTGSGIPPHIIDRVFEPFFTTKGSGQGSGLGLSMIYGFAKQSNGHVDIDSALDIGTVVRLYLPRTTRAVEPAADLSAAEAGEAAGEMILVVEDNTNVRKSVVTLLKELGYRTLEAADGLEALAVLERDPRVDLLFSDIVLPAGISGRQLAAATRRKRPDVKILLTSGFPDRATDARPGERRNEIIYKPYRRQDLALKLREVLQAEDG